MPQPGGAPPGSPQQAPFGASPMSGPTANKGFEAAGLQKLGVLIKAMSELIPLLGATTDPGKDVLKALSLLTKHVPSGSVTPAAEKNQLEAQMMKNTQNNQQMQALKAQQPGGGQAAPPQGMPQPRAA